MWCPKLMARMAEMTTTQIWGYLSAKLLMMHMFTDKQILQPQID